MSLAKEREDEGDSPTINLLLRGTPRFIVQQFLLSMVNIKKTDEVVTVSGKLEPLGSVQDIQMPLGGIASEILVEDAEEVKWSITYET